MSSTERIRSRLGDLTVSQDSRRRPVKSTERNPGPYPYYGASGIVDYVDSFIFEGLHLLIAEDGENLRSRNTPVAFLADGQFWVNNHAHVLQGNSLSDTRYLAYAVEQLDLSGYLTGSTQPKLTKAALDSVMLDVPPLAEQQAISEVLGALDDKIAANIALAFRLSELLEADYLVVARTATRTVPLSRLVSTQYGVTTSAVPDTQGTGLVRVTDINKRPWIEWDGVPGCVLDELDRQKYLLHPGDIVVARMADPGKAGWVSAGDPPAVFASYLVRLRAHEPSHAPFIYQFLRSPEYLRYADGAMQGSVQKNMNAKVIVATEVPQPDGEKLRDFALRFDQSWALMASHLRENHTLAATRDALLPQLMSGKLRVRDAEDLIVQAGV